ARRALAVRGPVGTGRVLGTGEARSVELRAGQDVMRVGRVASTVDDVALLGQRSLLAELVVVRVQIVDVLGHHDALGVVPRTGANAVTGVDGLGRQVRAPRLAARADRGGELLAMGVGAGQAAQVGAVAGTDA